MQIISGFDSLFWITDTNRQTNTNKVYARGNNNYGQLGIGDAKVKHQKGWKQVFLPANLKIKKIVATPGSSIFFADKNEIFISGYQPRTGLNSYKPEPFKTPEKEGIIDVCCVEGLLIFLTEANMQVYVTGMRKKTPPFVYKVKFKALHSWEGLLSCVNQNQLVFCFRPEDLMEKRRFDGGHLRYLGKVKRPVAKDINFLIWTYFYKRTGDLRLFSLKYYLIIWSNKLQKCVCSKSLVAFLLVDGTIKLYKLNSHRLASEIKSIKGIKAIDAAISNDSLYILTKDFIFKYTVQSPNDYETICLPSKTLFGRGDFGRSNFEIAK